MDVLNTHDDGARQLLAANIDPSALRQSEKIATAPTLEALAIEWLAAGCPGWAVADFQSYYGRNAQAVATYQIERNV